MAELRADGAERHVNRERLMCVAALVHVCVTATRAQAKARRDCNDEEQPVCPCVYGSAKTMPQGHRAELRRNAKTSTERKRAIEILLSCGNGFGTGLT